MRNERELSQGGSGRVGGGASGSAGLHKMGGGEDKCGGMKGRRRKETRRRSPGKQRAAGRQGDLSPRQPLTTLVALLGASTGSRGRLRRRWRGGVVVRKSSRQTSWTNSPEDCDERERATGGLHPSACDAHVLFCSFCQDMLPRRLRP